MRKWITAVALAMVLGGAAQAADIQDKITDVQPDGTLVTAQNGPIQLSGIKLPDGDSDRTATVDYMKHVVVDQPVTIVDKGSADDHKYEVMFNVAGQKYPLGWTLISRHLATAAPGGMYVQQARVVAIHDSSPVANAGKLPDTGRVLRLTGHCSVEGCNAIGIFHDGASSTPLKTGSVDANGDYVLDIDLDKDLHTLQGSYKMCDIRFFQNGAFDMAHGKCNFVVYDGSSGSLQLQVYEGPKYEIHGRNFEYSEKD